MKNKLTILYFQIYNFDIKNKIFEFNNSKQFFKYNKNINIKIDNIKSEFEELINSTEPDNFELEEIISLSSSINSNVLYYLLASNNNNLYLIVTNNNFKIHNFSNFIKILKLNELNFNINIQYNNLISLKGFELNQNIRIIKKEMKKVITETLDIFNNEDNNININDIIDKVEIGINDLNHQLIKEISVINKLEDGNKEFEKIIDDVKELDNDAKAVEIEGKRRNKQMKICFIIFGIIVVIIFLAILSPYVSFLGNIFSFFNSNKYENEDYDDGDDDGDDDD